MKKLILCIFCSTMLFATNGDNLIGLGSKSRAMGGVGIAIHFGAENILVNPAMIAKSKDTEINIGATLFMPTVKAKGIKSKADMSIMPEISSSMKIDENWAFGIGMFGAAGMGVDYRGEASLMEARTNLMLMKIAPTIAYRKDSFAIGIAPAIQYGSLNISYDSIMAGGYVGEGKSDDFGYGFAIGSSYNISKDLTLGFVYKSEIDMTYRRTLSVASAPFFTMGVFPSVFEDDLTQPAEIGAGISYDIHNFNVSFDYKKVFWSDARGYKDFGWQDQNIYALGAKYEKNDTWYALGYNYAKHPISTFDTVGNPMSTAAATNMFNYLLFPATSEQHFTIGAGTKISKNFSIDCGIVYSPNKKVTVDTTIGTLKVEHQESSVALAIRYNY